MDTLFAVIKPLIAPPSLLLPILAIGVAHLVVLPYFATPEKFFIKKLRPQKRDGITHTQLILRAFVGIGLIYSGFSALAFTQVHALHHEMSGWEFAQRWLELTLGGGLIVGTGGYLVLRITARRRNLKRQERNPP